MTYYPCVANKLIKDKQITVCWHVDDLKVSHHDPNVVDDFLEWIRGKDGEIGELKITRGKTHDYLGMILDYSVPGQVSVDMTHYGVSESEPWWKQGQVPVERKSV
jgi:hypothetical protein